MGQFIETLGQAGQGLMGQAAGGIMGMLFGGMNDQRQQDMEEWLQALQIKGQKEMTDYNLLKQLELWEKTGYGAQMDQLKRAGLNQALLYGMSGGGGQSTNVNTGNVSRGNAPTGGGEAMAGMGMGLNLAMMKAQKDVLEAQARNLNVEADNKEGVVRTNIGADTELKQVHARIGNLDAWIKDKSKQDQIDIIQWQANKLVEEVRALERENKVDARTAETRIKLVKTELIQKLLQNTLIKEQTETERKKPMLLEEQTRAATHSIWQKWQQNETELSQLSVQEAAQRLQSIINDVPHSERIGFDVLEGVAQILLLKGLIGGKEHNEIKGFSQKR